MRGSFLANKRRGEKVLPVIQYEGEGSTWLTGGEGEGSIPVCQEEREKSLPG
jgi:hypothetical protein